MTESFLYSTSILPSKGNISTLYNYVIQSSAGRNSDVKLNTKSRAQVIGKLDYKKRRLDAILSRLSESQINETTCSLDMYHDKKMNYRTKLYLIKKLKIMVTY